jgi:hypothetical protein
LDRWPNDLNSIELFAVKPELFVQKVQTVQAVRFEKTGEVVMLAIIPP